MTLTASTLESFESLASDLREKLPQARIDVTAFPSGAASLSVAHDERLFVMEFAPSLGFGVDEVHANEGFLHQYALRTDDFQQAADKLIDITSRRQRATLNLVVIYTADLQRSKQFYETIGLTFVPEKHNRGPAHLACQFGYSVFELYPAKNAASATSTVRLGLRVDSVEHALNRLKEAGIEPVGQPQDSPWGRRAVVRDPDGNTIELTSAS